MKICIVIQSAAFLSSAGARIRYNRLTQFERSDVQDIAIIPLPDLIKEKIFTADIYIFVKCFTADALILAQYLRNYGKVIGHDIFDDYFSQPERMRLELYRSWLRTAAQSANFVVCTTDRMHTVLRTYFKTIPITVVGDPMESEDFDRVRQLVENKSRRMASNRDIQVVWFGIGDNPFFSVGLRDLVPQSTVLAQLRRSGWRVHLTVLTNIRALSSEGLAYLRHIPVPVYLKEWSEAEEAAALDEADVAFIPVNSQSFSRAKSLNRAITALAHGCQVLSTGYPLYAPLRNYIYDAASEFEKDLNGDCLKVNASTMSELWSLLRKLSDPGAGSEAFLSAALDAHRLSVDGIPSGTEPTDNLPKICLINGIAAPTEQHKLVSRFRGVSVRTPFTKPDLNFHLRFDVGSNGLEILVEQSLAQKLAANLREGMRTAGTINAFTFQRIEPIALGLSHLLPNRSLESGLPIARYAVYRTVMGTIRSACQIMLPQATIIANETNPFVPKGVMARL